MVYPIFFVSLGAGDPQLVTLKAIKALSEADYIFLPSTQLNSGAISSYAQEILKSYDLDDKQVELFQIPMKKDRSEAMRVYADVSEKLIELQKQKQKIVVAAEGDISFYASIHNIYDNLKNKGVVVEKVPGIPAFIACGALLNQPLVQQKEELEVIPHAIELDELKAKVKQGKVLVLMKISQSETVLKQALRAIPQAQFHYFENVGIKGKEFYSNDRKEIEEREFLYFSIMIIKNGELV